MKVDWLLAVFIAIVTANLVRGQVMFQVRGRKTNLDQSAVSKVTHVWHDKVTPPVSTTN